MSGGSNTHRLVLHHFPVIPQRPSQAVGLCAPLVWLRTSIPTLDVTTWADWNISLPHWDKVQAIKPHSKFVVTWDYKCPMKVHREPGILSFLSPWNTQNGFQARTVSRKHRALGSTEILKESEPSIPLGAIPLQFVYSEVFTSSPGLCTPVAAVPSGS